MTDYIDIVFDGPPSHESGRFVEVEDSSGASIHAGEWVDAPPFWRLRMPDPRRIAALKAENERLIQELEDAADGRAVERHRMEAEIAKLRERLRSAEAVVDAARYLAGFEDDETATQPPSKRSVNLCAVAIQNYDNTKEGDHE